MMSFEHFSKSLIKKMLFASLTVIGGVLFFLNKDTGAGTQNVDDISMFSVDTANADTPTSDSGSSDSGSSDSGSSDGSDGAGGGGDCSDGGGDGGGDGG